MYQISLHSVKDLMKVLEMQGEEVAVHFLIRCSSSKKGFYYRDIKTDVTLKDAMEYLTEHGYDAISSRSEIRATDKGSVFEFVIVLSCLDYDSVKVPRHYII